MEFQNFNRSLLISVAAALLSSFSLGCGIPRQEMKDLEQRLEHDVEMANHRVNDQIMELAFSAQQLTFVKAQLSVLKNEFDVYRTRTLDIYLPALSNHKNNSIVMKIPFSHYSFLKNDLKELQSLPEIIGYLHSPKNLPIESLAKLYTHELKTKEESAKALISFVHDFFPYVDTSEKNVLTVKYPLVTLVERGGTILDYSVFLVSLLKSVDIDTVFLKYSLPNGGIYLAVGIAGDFNGKFYEKNGKKFYFSEVFTDHPIGEINIKLKKIKPIIYSFE